MPMLCLLVSILFYSCYYLVIVIVNVYVVCLIYVIIMLMRCGVNIYAICYPLTYFVY